MINTRQQQGFTIIEAVIVLIIIAVLAGGAAVLLATAMESQRLGQDYSQVTRNAQLAYERMSREIRLARAAHLTISPTSLAFVDLDGHKIVYALRGTNLQRNDVTVAEGVTRIRFAGYSKAGARTGIAANIRLIAFVISFNINNTLLTIESAIAPRNF